MHNQGEVVSNTLIPLAEFRRYPIRALIMAAIWASASFFTELDAQLPAPPREITVDENGIDVRTGNESYQQSILNIGPAGEMGLHLARYLSSGVTRDSFDSTYYEVRADTGIWSIDASFGNMGDAFGSYGTDVGASFDNGSSEGPRYQHASGVIVTFGQLIFDQSTGDNSSAIYRLATKVQYPNGVILTVHYKTINGLVIQSRIQSITSNTGYQVKFRYKTNTQGAGWADRVSATGINNAVEYCDPDADDCSLLRSWPVATYSSSSDGYSITNPSGERTLYFGASKTSSSPELFTITLPGSTSPNFRYEHIYLASACGNASASSGRCSIGSDFRVAKVITPFKTTSYSYNYQNGIFDEVVSQFENPDTKEIVTNKYKSWGAGAPGIQSWTDPQKNVHSYKYDLKGLITQSSLPLGQRYEWKRDLYGNATEKKLYSKDGASSIIEFQTFGSCQFGLLTCNRPTSLTDPSGTVTNIRYNSRGQKISELAGAGVDGSRALTRWKYVERFASIKTSTGQTVQLSTPISVLFKIIKCQSTSNNNLDDPQCNSTADEVVTEYEYGSNTNPILPIGETLSAGGIFRRTCYGYDIYGNRISESKPRAKLEKCSAS